MPVPQTLDELRVSLRQSVDALQRRQASEIPEQLIDRLVDLDWLEWHGGNLRLTTTGANIHRQEIVRVRALAESSSGSSITPNLTEATIATPNYQYEKRQRELAKKKKKEEKAQRKAAGSPPAPASETPDGEKPGPA
ncbi:hypothetical protein SAMN05428960_0240 [Mitsuaria sp. PDC51]|jgi:hypothetical protein|uniref:hypothetical protein n=1 Tax=unclassified Roseateles TaxID=2626991 RepID=UPI0008E4894E|nr:MULTISPECIES: hypothetical protein [unclassified Roseateles]MBB3284466.1 hypothetical protein [Mitsuaria sp. BK037]MBB3291591.1 hypothetical protein [Mitsuaria sp. BK041]MBB3360808.1 hypothetical protein [Mitsuaria sp. BK045]SFR70761.1 hypothetical protein SAMN05428960_0240 [Mitsuaria sp. PDC51]